ncbi:MAG: hypothetical protein P0Y49_13750 [Candidatus Pedobacter colombiensis]|uniref:TerB family tellurite resistance protein n=1 Tax=Candidatus Pedobacter colombiensis TaxID=3121371 RepID=A0AAJ5W672_9SPHI|nr:hypothetical protein [Pedobacter sp.]WEK17863.1 MAG: hypothetical protein P0Y49_13750 [Pedobacter sp.]
MESKNNIRKIAVLICLLLAFTTQLSQAQTFSEFFKQEKTQKKYLLQQIAALEVYIGYAKKGYDIANSGLRTIKDITNGEFGLHSAFINSLKAVNPVIRNNVKVAEIIECQIRISKAFGAVQYSDALSIKNRLYVQNVQENVMDECESDLEELLLVITSGRLEMSDKERLRRLNRINESMVNKFSFTIDFMGQVMMLIRQTEKEQEFIYQLKKYYEID